MLINYYGNGFLFIGVKLIRFFMIITYITSINTIYVTNMSGKGNKPEKGVTNGHPESLDIPLSVGGGSTDSVSVELRTTVLPSIFATGTEPYKDWVCSISFKLMVDPVVAQDGHTYERTDIETWLRKNSTSPMDRSSITNTKLYPNIGLKTAIQLWKNNNPDFVQKDEQFDRQIEMASLRTKPVPSPIPRQSTFITNDGMITFPGWNVVQNMLNISSRSSSHSLSPRISPLIQYNS
jgi:hypothetical protein